MPDPISSSSSIPWTPAEPEDSSAPEDEGGVCEDPYAGVGPLAELVESPEAPPTNNNAQRTTARLSSGYYAEAGLTSSGDSVFAGVALGKKHDPVVEADAEALSASVQVGVQNEAQVGVARVGDTEGQLTGSVETLTARAHAGVRNDDGSIGLNFGAGATILGGEATYTFEGGNSFTFGAAGSFGIGGSFGLRDADADGRHEACFRVSGAVLTFGGCVED